MMVNKSDYELVFQDVVYVFCSQQCLVRFNTSPNLYVGMPGHPAPKQQGQEIIKKRLLKLAEPFTPDQQHIIKADLMSMMGIHGVHIKSECVSITYDLLQATVEQIEAMIEKSGDKLGGGLTEKLKRAFIHYLEETELDNLEQPDHKHRH